MFLLVLFFAFSFNSYAKCTKKITEEMVDKVCDFKSVRVHQYKIIREEANKLLSEALTNNECKNNYVWVQDENVRMIAHPIKTGLNDKNMAGYKDPDGIPLFTHFYEVVKNSPKTMGWVQYKWRKPTEEKEKAKVSFVKRCKGGLIAGSGLWIEDLNLADRTHVIKLVNEDKKYLESK